MKPQTKILLIITAAAATVAAALFVLLRKKSTTEEMSQTEQKNYTLADATPALREIYRQYGRDLAVVIEKMYRVETAHFTSGQYRRTGSPGMEAAPGKLPPYYGWESAPWIKRPDLAPIGTWSAFENAGMSAQGGNAQDTTNKKRFIVFPSVYAGMYALAEYILRHNGNYARWYSTNSTNQQLYRDKLATITPRIVNTFS
jgi:hypothetical protein